MRHRHKAETNRINNYLQSHGLGRLDDPGVLAQMGFLVEDHEHFKQLLNACEPAERPSMYNALTPHFRFEPKPLDVYIAELGQAAEREQLPVIGEDGKLYPFQVQEIGTAPELSAEEKANADLLAHANKLAEEAIWRKVLEVVCTGCTKEATFGGIFKQDCLDKLREAGWKQKDGKEYCPECR